LTDCPTRCHKSSASKAPDPGRHHVGTPGDIIPECPGDVVGIRSQTETVPKSDSPTRETFAAWQASASAALQREHGIAPGSIPARVWKHAYVQGLTPEAAADEAAVSAYNVRPASDRLHQHSKKR
jgi:hypothetical protein